MYKCKTSHVLKPKTSPAVKCVLLSLNSSVNLV